MMTGAGDPVPRVGDRAEGRAVPIALSVVFVLWAAAGVAIFAATLWSALHALFHVHVWIDRGLPFDGIFLFDLCAVIAPPFVVLALCGRRTDAAASARGDRRA